MTGRYKGRDQQDFPALIDKVPDSAVNHSELKVHYTLKLVWVGGQCMLLTLKFIILQRNKLQAKKSQRWRHTEVRRKEISFKILAEEGWGTLHKGDLQVEQELQS